MVSCELLFKPYLKISKVCLMFLKRLFKSSFTPVLSSGWSSYTGGGEVGAASFSVPEKALFMSAAC